MPEFTAAALARALDQATAAVKTDVMAGAAQAARDVARELQHLYPIGPGRWDRGRRVPGGTLRRSVVVRERPGGWMVRATAPHVHLWEDGTEPRHDPTRGRPPGAYRGVMPRQGPIFIPTAIRERTEWLRAAAALLDQGHEL